MVVHDRERQSTVPGKIHPVPACTFSHWHLCLGAGTVAAQFISAGGTGSRTTDFGTCCSEICAIISSSFQSFGVLQKSLPSSKRPLRFAALGKSAQPRPCYLLAKKKKKSHLSQMLDCGKNRLFSSSSCPANHNLRDVRRIMCSPAGWGQWREWGRLVEFQIGFGHAASQCQVKKSHWVWAMNTPDRVPGERETPKGLGTYPNSMESFSRIQQSLVPKLFPPWPFPHCPVSDLPCWAFPEPDALEQRWEATAMSDCNIFPQSGISPKHYQPHPIPRKDFSLEWKMQLLSTTLRSLNSRKECCTSLLSVFCLSSPESISKGLDSKEQCGTS